LRSEPHAPAPAPEGGAAGGGVWRPPRPHRPAGGAMVPGPERRSRALRPLARAAHAARGGAEARMRRSGLIALAAASALLVLVGLLYPDEKRPELSLDTFGTGPWGYRAVFYLLTELR